MAIEDFIPGTDKLLGSLGRFALKLAAGGKKVDGEAAAEMVEVMRATVSADSKRSGALLNGITTYQEDGTTVVEASAVRPGDFDYARPIEFGRYAGDNPFDAEPFFFPAVNEALEARGLAMDDVIDTASAEEDLR